MDKIVEFNNVNFSYNNKTQFSDFNFSISENDISFLVGSSSSGKTTLLKMLCHKLPNENCYYKNKLFSEIDVNILKKEVIVVFDEDFHFSNIKDEIIYYFKQLNESEEDIETNCNEIMKLFDLKKIENISTDKLVDTDKLLIKILRYLIIKPCFIAIDSIFTNLNYEDKRKIISFAKNNKITMLIVTSDLNDTLLGDKIYVLDDFKLILEGTTSSVLKTDTLLKRLGFNLPLAVDLSIELIHYDVLKKIYTDTDKLVKAIWK